MFERHPTFNPTFCRFVQCAPANPGIMETSGETAPDLRTIAESCDKTSLNNGGGDRAVYVLGLVTMGTSAACLFKDGKLVAAVEEERLTRIKNDGAFPIKAIGECLACAGITMRDVGAVAVYWKPWRIWQRLRATFVKGISSPRSISVLAGRVLEVARGKSNNRDRPEDTGSWGELFKVRSILTRNFDSCPAEVFYADHHLTHQYYAEAMRDWDNFISLSYDGGGEENSSVLVAVNGGKRDIISEHAWPNSLGHFYSFFTGYLGFKMLEGEYKMMGLAPYGQPKWRDLILEKLVKLKPNGRYELDSGLCDYHSALRGEFPPELTAMFCPPRQQDALPSADHVDLAASVQAALEVVQQHMLSEAKVRYPALDRLVISGGCALNVTANGKVLDRGLFKEIIIPPAPHDAGCCIGAVLTYFREKSPDVIVDKESIRSPYSGRLFSDADIEPVAKKYCRADLPALLQEEVVKKTAELLSQGKIISWFQGRSEFGPRALGNRSFLADPRQDSIREAINAKIKKRELFRPFAPSCTEESASEYFELDQSSPYMNIVATVRPEKRGDIPAVTHTDGTARVHTVSKAANPAYHALISCFGEITGVPVLLNTSFNIQEPIVYSPEDAFHTFKASGVDALAIGPFVVLRSDLA
jgi:carbamoyltransferase